MTNSTTRKLIYLPVPDSFDALTIAKKHRQRAGHQQLLADRLNWFVSRLEVLPMRQDVRKELETRGYISLQQERFRGVYRSDKVTTEIVNILVKEQVVQRDKSYRAGSYSMGYRLSPALRTGKTKQVAVVNRDMSRYIHNYREKGKKERVARTRSIRFLTDFIEDTNLKVDMEAAHGFIEHWVDRLVKKIHSEKEQLGEEVAAELVNRAYTKVYYTKKLLLNINNPETRFRYWNRDVKGMRLHSSFSGLKSPLRHFLRYGDEQLVSVDIKASQPYLFTKLLNEDFWGTKNERVTLKTIHPQLYQQYKTNGTIDAIIMSLRNPITYSQTNSYDFTNLNWERDYYTMMMKRVAVDFKSHLDVLHCFSTREKTKYHNMLLFFEPRTVNRAYVKPFQQYFPQAYRIMNLLRESPGLLYTTEKKRSGVASPKNNNLPVLLQRLESYAVLETICAKINKERPDVFLLTIHDSIITKASQREIVERYLREGLKEIVGTTPGLTTDDLHPDNYRGGFEQFIEQEWNEMRQDLSKRTKKGQRLASDVTQQLLGNLRTFASQPLVMDVLPKWGGKTILSTRYISESSLDALYDEE